jgi:ADP-ribosylglycohydrolase
MNKFITSNLLASFGDIYGFRNGEFEFNFNIPNYNNENTLNIYLRLIVEHFSEGGLLQFKFDKYHASDDTLLMIASIKGILNNNFLKEYLLILPQLKDKKRASGIQTLKSLSQHQNNKYQFTYNPNAGGNGSAIRVTPIGLFYNDNIKLLIEKTIENTLLTHPNGIAIYGSIFSALFTSFAYNNKSINEWISSGLKLIIENKKLIDTTLLKYIKKTELEYYQKDFNKILILIEKFINKINTLQKSNNQYFVLKETFKETLSYNANDTQIGNNAIDCVIWAYHSLQINHNNLEGVLFNSGIHAGDSDSTAFLAGAWYGAYYGNINIMNIEKMEFYEEINDLSKKLYLFRKVN